MSAPPAGATASAPAPHVSIGTVVARAAVSGQSRIVAAATIDTAGALTASGGSPDEATAAIEAVAPPLAELLRLMRPRSPGRLWTMLGVLLMALQMALTLAQDQGLSEQEIARLIDQAVERVQPSERRPAAVGAAQPDQC